MNLNLPDLIYILVVVCFIKQNVSTFSQVGFLGLGDVSHFHYRIHACTFINMIMSISLCIRNF